MIGSCFVKQPHPQPCHYCKEWETETDSGSLLRGMTSPSQSQSALASELAIVTARWCHSVRQAPLSEEPGTKQPLIQNAEQQ